MSSIDQSKARAETLGSQYGHQLKGWKLRSGEWSITCARSGCSLVVGIELTEPQILGWGGGQLKKRCPGA